MKCTSFEDWISEYLDGGLERAERRDFCEHLLACRECRLTFEGVREAMAACRGLIGGRVPAGVVTATVGEMLGCQTFDLLIADYFDGLDGEPFEALFGRHFEGCEDCRRLVEGVRQALEEAELAEVGAEIDLPEDLSYRILAATAGARR